MQKILFHRATLGEPHDSIIYTEVHMEEKLQLELTVDNVNIVLEALGELPAKRTLSTIQDILDQSRPQLESRKEAASE